MTGMRHTDEFLKEIAEHYQKFSLLRPFKPNAHIAAKYGVPVNRVESWIKAARHKKILEPHSRQSCERCGQTLAALPPIIGHHLKASMQRMADNAEALQERCLVLADEAESDEHQSAYRIAARHYGSIIQIFEGLL